MKIPLEERLPELFDSLKCAPASPPRDVYRRLQFVARVMRRGPGVAEADAMLLWLDPQGSVNSASVTADGVIVGRDPSCDIVLADRRVSRRHARVSRGRCEFHVEDLQSSNGTLVNGVRLDAAHRLQDGDVIEMGGTPIAFVAADL